MRDVNLKIGSVARMREVDKKAFGARVASRRASLGMTQTTLAAKVGMRQQSIDDIEHGVVARPRLLREMATALKTTEQWLLWRDGPEQVDRETEPEKSGTVPLVGYVGAGATAHFFSDQGELGRVRAPEGSTEDTVAVEIRGDSLGSFFDRWIVFYDDVRRPVTSDLLGQLCVVGTEDGRILIKKIQRSRTRGLFHLLSQTEAPILDIGVEWAARVKNMVPR